MTTLNFQFSWEGTFSYPVQENGHFWYYADKDSWRSPHGSLCDLAKTLGTDNRRKVCDIVTTVAPSEIPEWNLLDWLATDDDDASPVRVGRGLSVMLNSIVRDATLRDFQILSTFVQDNATVEIRGLSPKTPNWFYLRGPGASSMAAVPEYLLTLPQQFTADKAVTLVSLAPDEHLHLLLSQLRFIRVLHSYSITSFERTSSSIRIRVKDIAELCDYSRGRICGCIPIPGKSRSIGPSEPRGIHSAEVVVASPVVQAALEDLSRIWQDPFAKSILISAPPGSGKEDFSNSIPYGNGRDIKRMQTLSLASSNFENIERQLYGFQRSDGSIEEGLISKASGSALFLDEVHQPDSHKDSPLRASLLRPLEANEYFPVNSNDKCSVGNVLFIMATSKSLAELGHYRPPDFWTRVTHALSIKHPLDFACAEHLPTHIGVISFFFSFFWWDRIQSHFQREPIVSPSNDEDARGTLHTQLTRWQVHSMSTALCAEGDNFPLRFASIFVEELNRGGIAPADFSIRGIRSMVTRLFSMAVANISQGMDMWRTNNDFDKNVQLVFNEILKVARLK